MKNLDKSKGELLRELDALKKENADLKAMYEKDIKKTSFQKVSLYIPG